jgi:hypothetical protein
MNALVDYGKTAITVFGYHFENQNQTRTFAVNRNITAGLLLKNRTSIILASLTFSGLPSDIYVADSPLILYQEYTRSGHHSTPLHFLFFRGPVRASVQDQISLCDISQLSTKLESKICRERQAGWAGQRRPG